MRPKTRSAAARPYADGCELEAFAWLGQRVIAARADESDPDEVAQATGDLHQLDS